MVAMSIFIVFHQNSNLSSPFFAIFFNYRSRKRRRIFKLIVAKWFWIYHRQYIVIGKTRLHLKAAIHPPAQHLFHLKICTCIATPYTYNVLVVRLLTDEKTIYFSHLYRRYYNNMFFNVCFLWHFRWFNCMYTYFLINTHAVSESTFYPLLCFPRKSYISVTFSFENENKTKKIMAVSEPAATPNDHQMSPPPQSEGVKRYRTRKF